MMIRGFIAFAVGASVADCLIFKSKEQKLAKEKAEMLEKIRTHTLQHQKSSPDLFEAFLKYFKPKFIESINYIQLRTTILVQMKMKNLCDFDMYIGPKSRRNIMQSCLSKLDYQIISSRTL